MSPETITEELRNHQLSVKDWDKKDIIQNLHVWAERFRSEFKLKNPDFALMLDTIKKSCYGHFKPGRNGFGLLYEIAINETYVQERKYYQVLGTLLHEQLHAEQEAIGKPGKNNYHNKEYRRRAEQFGLIVDEWGHTTYAQPPTAFWDILDKYGINTPVIPSTPVHIPGKSKLKLWVCKCIPAVRVRVGRKDFRAKCLICGCEFVQAC